MAYISVDFDLKPYLGISSETSDDDALLAQIVTRTQAIVDRYCGRTFEASANTTRYFDAMNNVNGRELYFDTDICSIASITNGDGTTVLSTEYTTRPRNSTPYFAVVLKLGGAVVWTWDAQPDDAIAVSGKWAYSLSAPDDIKHACIRLAGYLYHQKDSSSDLDRTAFVGGAVLAPANMPSDLKLLLEPYKRLTI